jgi:hypothetical protein
VALAQFLTAYLSAIAVELGTIVTLLTITGWIGSASYGRLLPTVVHFDRQQFSISKRLFNWILPLDNGSTTTIAAVSQALKLFQSGSTSQEEPVVILQTSDGERLFGRGLSQEECAWVVDVIQQWLG